MNEADQVKMIGKIEREIADEKSKANKAGPSKKVAAADKQTELRKRSLFAWLIIGIISP
jgi:hypothetical protein